MKLKKLIVTSLLVFTFLTVNAVSPEIANMVTGNQTTSIAYARSRSSSSGFKSGGFTSGTSKSSGYKSGSFKSGSSLFGGSSSTNKSGSYKSYSSRSFIPIPIPFFTHHYYGSSLAGGIFSAYLFGKLIKLLLIIFVIYIIYRFLRRRR